MKKVIVGMVLLIGIGCFSLYKPKDEEQVLREETLNSSNLVGVYIQNGDSYTKSDTIPESGYEFNQEESYCKIGDNRQDNITLNYNQDTKELSVTPLSSKDTKCYLYFDEQKIQAADIILAGKNIDDSRSGAITGSLTTNTTGTVFSVEDDDGTSYMYAGAPTDNWVQFAGFYWRIIRINGDGSIRMIYNGTSTTTSGASTQIQTSTYNSSYNDNAYVGYMYGSTGASSYSATHANNNNSTIKGVLDNWYKNNLLNYSDYISTEAGFCNDRSINTTSETWWSGDTKLGYGTNDTAYGLYGRLLLNGSFRSSQNPSLECTQESNDLFTVSESSRGNRELVYPVGLITGDEVVLAGGFGGTQNQNFYLYTHQGYWTMSPYRLESSAFTHVFIVGGNGHFGNSNVHNTYGVRPVINLSADTLLTGSGTSSDPFVVEGA